MKRAIKDGTGFELQSHDARGAQESIGMLRQKDPALGAAIDELDLELLD
jgi:hypothetical protein